MDTIIEVSKHSPDRGVNLFFSASCCEYAYDYANSASTNFRALTGPSDKHPSPQPLLDQMARYLVTTPSLRISIIRAFSMLAVSDPNGVLLISERTILVPCLTQLLHRESSKVWGIGDDSSE